MDSTKFLIILNGEDKTESIASIKKQDDVWRIAFANTAKTYTYKYDKVIFLTNPQRHTKPEKLGIYNAKFALIFEKYCKIFFDNGTTKLLETAILLPNVKSSNANVFLYCKELATIVGVKNEDNESLLSRAYNKIDMLVKESVLSNYLHPSQPHRTNEINTPILSPFGLNASQYQAICNALESQISIIEGPPGTGKTQSILNIIANSLFLGKNVAVVSNNNAATDNVFMKLEKYGLTYLCAKLGKKDNIKQFLQNQSHTYPDFAQSITQERKDTFSQAIKKLNIQAQEIFTLQNAIAKQKTMLSALELEFHHFTMQENLTIRPHFLTLLQKDSTLLLKTKIALENTPKGWRYFLLVCKLFLIQRIGNFTFYKLPLQDIIQHFEYAYYMQSIATAREILTHDTKRLEILRDTQTLEHLQEYSLTLLQESLRIRYGSHTQRPIFSEKDLLTNAEQFCDEYPIIFSTTHAIKNCFGRDFLFDYLIIDEASQVDLVTGVLALSVARNIVIVGDTKQLPNVIDSTMSQQIQELTTRYKIPPHYDYMQHSFLSSVCSVLPNAPSVLLKEHYRCHPKIINFCNQKFYGSELVILSEDNGEANVLEAYVSPAGNHARGHYNQREIDIIANEILPNTTIEPQEIGIITPYNEQKARLQNAVGEIEADTVHKYQGREKDLIIIATTDNQSNDFIDDSKMLNVAITRAKKQLKLIVSYEVCHKQNTNINDFIRYITYQSAKPIESKIYSIFDLLYKANAQARALYLKGKRRISQFDSENIAFAFIKDILQQDSYHSLDVLPHIPLAKVIKIDETLTQEEKLYAQNPLTHFDFIIYHIMDKAPLLAVEIDGYAFHHTHKQLNRDRLKDSICKKHNLPLLRLSTTQSAESKRLKDMLQALL
ncbi:AAA domain-containing protein [Campylobacter upsaliensis]|uniref:AAA domain-containing protein n=1 Tax=Campylobacter upsaliensis TaxID=28080 RepID=UPI002B38F716|nr:AAA domain-containing protein [Campylobacter upsaliensis]MEB2807808.1 AAA domain-containing protein [Campylobacter upsaliensis]